MKDLQKQLERVETRGKFYHALSNTLGNIGSKLVTGGTIILVLGYIASFAVGVTDKKRVEIKRKLRNNAA